MSEEKSKKVDRSKISSKYKAVKEAYDAKGIIAAANKNPPSRDYRDAAYDPKGVTKAANKKPSSKDSDK